MSRLVVIDGNAILHRAYHALPPLTAPNGQQVNAVYGFATMVFRILDELTPEYLIVAFDRKEPTFRKTEYVAYQSKRKEMDKELVGQIELVHELVEALGIPQFSVAGFEADDVIGTLATQVFKHEYRISKSLPRRQAGETNSKYKIQNTKQQRGDNYIDSRLHGNDSGYGNDKEIVGEVVIVTGDRDLMQLVNDRVKLYMPTKGMSVGEIVDTAGVKERLGVLPNQVVDYKALVGDSSDNYPGIPGIGPKTALELIMGIGGIREIWENLGKVENEKLRSRLSNGRENAELSYRLATVVCDVPLEVDWEKCRLGNLANDNAIRFFKRMGFRSLVKRLGGGDGDMGNRESKIDDNQQRLF